MSTVQHRSPPVSPFLYDFSVTVSARRPAIWGLSCRFAGAVARIENYRDGRSRRVGASMDVLYRDEWIICTDDGIRIRWYYPWGDKRVPYAAIRSARRVRLDLLHGRGRIWGTANLRYWASLDPGRPGKESALILDLGRPVRPFITPDDTQAVENLIKEHSGLADIPHTGVGPFI
jgi:hypothetical protein